jgi:hypothetical protein
MKSFEDNNEQHKGTGKELKQNENGIEVMQK